MGQSSGHIQRQHGIFRAHHPSMVSLRVLADNSIGRLTPYRFHGRYVSMTLSAILRMQLISASALDPSPFWNLISRQRCLLFIRARASAPVLWIQSLIHLSPPFAHSAGCGQEMWDTQTTYISSLCSRRDNWWPITSRRSEDGRPAY